MLPLRRPQGKRKWLWLAHLAWLIVAVALAPVYAWSIIPSVWRWVYLALVVYGVATLPLILSRVLRTYWNAPEAERRNREIVAPRT